MGRHARLLAVLACSNPASAQTTTADAMSRYHAMMSVGTKPCAQATDRDEILVCARNKLRASQKVPYIEETRRGDRPRLAPGEVSSGDPGRPCGPRGEGCYEGPGLSGVLKAMIGLIKGD